MGEHLPATPPAAREAEPELAMAGMAGSNVPHPLHHIQPEVE
jgi:hypothetical protein